MAHGVGTLLLIGFEVLESILYAFPLSFKRNRCPFIACPTPDPGLSQIQYLPLAPGTLPIPLQPFINLFLSSFKAFLSRDYSIEMLPMLCWGAEMRTQLLLIKQGRHCWLGLLMRTRDPGTKTRYMQHPSIGFGLLRGTDKRLLSVSITLLVADCHAHCLGSQKPKPSGQVWIP